MTRTPAPRAWRLPGWGALGAGLLWACFSPPDLPGPYLCNQDGRCGESSRLSCVCGVCCDPAGEPACPTCTEPQPDAGRDGGVDAGTDAGTPDAGGDAGIDAGVVDAGCTTSPGTSCTSGPCTGTLVCDAGWLSCVPTAPRNARELCNRIDDNCNGVVDERPECGGPADLLGPADAAAGFLTGAQRIPDNAFSPQRVSCIKGFSGAVPQPWDGGNWIGQFGGSTSTTDFHVLYAEPADGGYWDLSGGGFEMYLAFRGPLNNGDPLVPFNFPQPQVYLCTSNTAARRYEPYLANAVLRWESGNVMVVDTVIILGDGGIDWRSASHTSFSPSQVARIEVVLAPHMVTGAQPSFDVNVTRWGFGPP